MTIYILLFLILLISSVLELKNTSISKFLFTVNIVILYIISTLRYGVGADYFQYQELFQQALPINEISYQYLSSNTHDIEYGYLIFESFIKFFTEEYIIFLSLYNFIMFLFLYLAINRISKYRNFQLFIFYSFIFLEYTINAYRQGMAICIAYYAFSYIYDSKFLRYFILVILSTTFHKIAIILLPVYFIVNRNYSVLFLLAIVSLSLAISYFDFIGVIIKFLFDRLPDIGAIRRVYHYYFNAHDPNLKIPFIAYLQRIIVLVILFLFYKKIDHVCANILILYVCFYFIFSNVGVMASRVSGMFLVSYVMLFPKLIYNLKIRNNAVIVFLYLVIFSFSMVVKDVQKKHPIYDRFTYLPYHVHPFFN